MSGPKAAPHPGTSDPVAPGPFPASTRLSPRAERPRTQAGKKAPH